MVPTVSLFFWAAVVQLRSYALLVGQDASGILEGAQKQWNLFECARGHRRARESASYNEPVYTQAKSAAEQLHAIVVDQVAGIL